jgi:methanogenic corrinoid protein MtbC1
MPGESEILAGLGQSLFDYDNEAAAMWAGAVVATGADCVKAMNVLTEAIRTVGDGFGRGELWLPDLIAAADAMAAATGIIEEEMRRQGARRSSAGSVVIGTVYGDIHSIGKGIVSTLLTANGFEVHDLGVNVKPDEFVAAVRQFQPDVLALSALLTTTAPEQEKVIQTLKAEGLRHKVRVIVGGGAITPDFARSIGADGYDSTAPGAVNLAQRLLAD